MGIFGNMMNNYFYGKAGKGDYRIQDMPQNRRQLFGAVLKVRWGSMVGVNLLYALVWIPAALWTIINLMTLMTPDALGEGTTYSSLFTMYLLILWPCIFITGPFSAGVAYVMRNWARDEHSFVLSDFWDAVKGNWKQSFVVSFISGALPFLLYVAWQFYGQLANNSVLYMLPLGLVFLVFVVWKMAEMVMYTMMVTYDLKLRDLFRNSILMTMAKLPLSLLIKLLTLLVPIIAIALVFVAPGIEIYVLLVLLLLYAAFIPAFNRLILASYANMLCEKYLNPNIEGARTNIGLRPEDWDDTEYIPQDDEE